MTDNFDFKHEVRVRAAPEVVWEALVRPEVVKRYHLAPLMRLELYPGGEVVYGTADEVMISGAVVDVTVNRRLAHTFRFGAPRHPGTEGEADSLVIYELRAEGGGTVLRLTHTGFTEENQTRANVVEGWPYILGQLKTWAESGAASQG